MENSTYSIRKLWEHKSTSSIILVMYELIENSNWVPSEKKKSYAVMKGIITYTDRGDDLLEHHRDYLRDEWKLAWSNQKDNSVKEQVKEWLLEPPF